MGHYKAAYSPFAIISLTLQNNSLITAPDVILTQTLPLSVAFDSASTAPTSSAGQTLVWQLGDLASLAGQDLIVTGTVDASATVGSTLVATAVVTSDLAEAVVSNNTRLFTTTMAGSDLLVSKSKAAPAQAYAGQPVTYTLTVTNTGPLTAADVVMTDTLPVTLNFVSEESPGLTFNPSTLSWQADDELGPGQALTVTLVVTPDEGLADGAMVTNTITATTATPELNLTNNEAEVSHTVQQPKPQLTLSPGMPTLSVAAGQTGTVTMTLGNSGQLALTGLVMTAPAVMPWVELTPASLPSSLAPGQQMVITVTAAPGESVPAGTIGTLSLPERAAAASSGPS